MKAGEPLATQDGSVVNRLSLWKGGLQMIAVAPLTGWGAGESGRSYMNWYQDVDRTEGYSTMVNSYLDIGVERGLVVLWAILCAFCWLIIASCRVSWSLINSNGGAERILRHGSITAASASLVGWAVTNSFTTLWIEPKLWVIPLLAIGLLAYTIFRHRHLLAWRWLATAGLMSTLTVVALYSIGIWLGSSNPLQIHLATSGFNNWIELSKKSARAVAPVASWNVWPDRDVLGPYPGKELRRWVSVQSESIRLRIAPDYEKETRSQPGRQFLFGQQAARLEPLAQVGTEGIFVIHPLGPPPAIRGQFHGGKVQSLLIILPEIDQQGNAPAWQKWAIDYGAVTIITAGVGEDIRHVWPRVTENWNISGDKTHAP